MMDKTFPRMPYTPPMNGTVIFFVKGTDPEDALRAALRQPDPTALRQPDPAAMREFLMSPPEPPEMHYLSPRGGYPTAVPAAGSDGNKNGKTKKGNTVKIHLRNPGRGENEMSLPVKKKNQP